ncbi:hypothetical protein AX14_005561 [Amanita brunnescens Koide BX004]|nr:hypothetical protein AX14_005561 [Amanita brunnescens Koide BX004]
MTERLHPSQSPIPLSLKKNAERCLTCVTGSTVRRLESATCAHHRNTPTIPLTKQRPSINYMHPASHTRKYRLYAHFLPLPVPALLDISLSRSTCTPCRFLCALSYIFLTSSFTCLSIFPHYFQTN